MCAGRTADSIVCCAKREPGIFRIRLGHQQFLRVALSLFDQAKTVKVTFLKNTQVIGLHLQGSGVERARIMQIKFEALQCNLSRAPVRTFKPPGACFVRLSLDASKQTFVIQKKDRGKNTLEIEFFKQIAGRD